MKSPRTVPCIAAAAALAGLFALAGCQLGDASIRVEWTINGESADSDTCDAAGGAWVRIIEDEDNDGAHDTGEWYSARRACRDGRFETLKHFYSGHTHYIAYELLDIYDAVVSRVPETGFRAFVPAAGVNQVDIDFPTGPVCGNDICDAGETPLGCPADCAAAGASASFAWYIHGVRGGQRVTIGTGQSEDEVCTVIQGVGGFAGPLGVQLWVDDDGDGTGDQLFDFACTAGQGLTAAQWTAGTALRFAFALLDAAGARISQSPVWESQALVAGENNLGTVDFYVGNYGPLGVTLTWADQVTTPAFVTCEALDPAQVSAMGYLLCSGSLSGGVCPAGMVIDEMNIDADPATCRNDLAWDILDFGTYTLVLDGEDALGTTLWGSECLDLSVTRSEPGENRFDCTVLMTATP